MRALLKPFAIHAAYSPIETIVFFSVIGTLAYFHILSAIKNSNFLLPTADEVLRPAHVLLRNGEWMTATERLWSHQQVDPGNSMVPVELQQLIFSLDTPERAREVRLLPELLLKSLKLASHPRLIRIPPLSSPPLSAAL